MQIADRGFARQIAGKPDLHRIFRAIERLTELRTGVLVNSGVFTNENIVGICSMTVMHVDIRAGVVIAIAIENRNRASSREDEF